MPAHLGSGHPAAFAILLMERTGLNKVCMRRYAASIAGLMALFIGFHVLRVAGQRRPASASRSLIGRPFLLVSRVARNILVRHVPMFPSLGHAVLVSTYLGLNLAFTFTGLSTDPTFSLGSNIGSRTGWMAMANTALLVLLALKNTPFAYLSAWSYERLNYLHRVVGYTAMAHILTHAVCYSVSFCTQGRASCDRLFRDNNVYGIAAGLSYLVIVLAAVLVRRFWYEAFYYVHVGVWAAAMVFVGLHQPDLEKGVWMITSLCAALWVADRLVRLGRIGLMSVNNSATIFPLPNGGTRIVLAKAPWGAASGQHSFLWIPAIRALETHPFTIAALDPPEFVVASYDGFTKDLHDHSMRRPGACLRASIEGPYGSLPNMKVFDRIIMIAGGSGASFVFGRALHMLRNASERRSRPPREQDLILVWVIRDQSYISWFATHLASLERSGRVNVQIYVTRSRLVGASAGQDIPQVPRVPQDPQVSQVPPSAAVANLAVTAAIGLSGEENKMEGAGHTRTAAANPRIRTCHLEDPEKADTDTAPSSALSSAASSSAEPSPTTADTVLRIGRPDVACLIREAVAGVPPSGRALVLGCGPPGMMTSVREGAVGCIRPGGAGVDVHCEGFGW